MTNYNDWDDALGFDPADLEEQLNLTCQHCGSVTTVTATRNKIRLWKEGALIQNVFPEFTADQRELLISGTCGTCWDNLFPDD